MPVGDACVSCLSHTSTNTTFLSKAIDYFSQMLLQRWEEKICRKEKSPQPGIELATTRSWVRHWAIRVGRCCGYHGLCVCSIRNIANSFCNSLQQNPVFLRHYVNFFSKTLREKEKMLVTCIFSFSHNVFSPIKDKNHHFKYFYFVVCKCLQYGPV